MVTIESAISKHCANFVASLTFSDLDEETIFAAKKCIIDWMGCTLGGSSTSAALIIESIVEDMGGKEQATLIGNFSKSSVLQASMVNAYNSHILEMDDVHKESIVHPAAPVISTAFSLAEYLCSSGRELIEAIVAGYDVMIRIGEAVAPSHYLLWHSTGTCGNFGAAASAAKLLHLDEKQTLDALGNAGSQAAGLWEFLADNAMTKYLHCGKAAFNGLLSALMAEKGFTGATKILEGDRGFFKAYSKETNFEESFKDMGKKYKIKETVFKPYASCRHTHGPIDGLLRIKAKHDLSYKDIDSVVVETYETALKIAGNTDFSCPLAAKFNIYYCLACALIFGRVSVSEFQEETLRDPRLASLIPAIHVNVTEEMNAIYPSKWVAKVAVKTKKGEVYTTFVEYPKGDPENPMTDLEVDEKYLLLATLKIEESRARKILEKCRSIDEFDSVGDFFKTV